jgi:sec-independent protein translocase protein TatA
VHLLEGDNEMVRLGTTELILILVIVILLFGVGRIGKVAGELGTGLRSFREGLKGDDDKVKTEAEEKKPETKEDSTKAE